ncbi:MAG: AMP-binding protein [Betaproteobacteria bacterium]|nr:AMP-binding protein [Betaproteobacteria bacterium]
MRPSGHQDSFSRDHLPPRSQWPVLLPPPEGLGYSDRLNAAQALLDHPPSHAAQPALRSNDLLWSYAQLQDQVDRIVQVIRHDWRLPTGSRVLLRGANHPMLAACWLAVIKAGCVAVTTMPLLRARELGVIADKARVQAALVQSDLLHEWQEVASGHALHTLSYGLQTHGQLQQAMNRHSGPCPAADTAQDDVALIAFTSGTTGVPKGTMHFHRDLLLIADVLSSHLLQPSAQDVFIGTPPLAFTFGLGGLLVFPLRVGACAVLQPTWTPESLLAGIAQYRATVCFTAPTFYRKMAPLATRDQLQTLRQCVSSGEMLPADTRAQWQAACGIEMTECLGSTEMLHAFIGCKPGAVRPGATGQVVPGYQACILDAQGQSLPPGEIGRLAVRGPTGCRYLDDTRQQDYVQQGWNLTGDAYRMDEEGYFWYQSRTDDMIVSAGYNIAGPEVEEVLLTHPEVAECGVVGAPDAERGQVVMAFVVRRPHTPDGATSRQLPDAALIQELQDWVKQSLAPYKYPRRIRFVSAMPRTENAKLQRFVLRQWAAGG